MPTIREKQVTALNTTICTDYRPDSPPKVSARGYLRPQLLDDEALIGALRDQPTNRQLANETMRRAERQAFATAQQFEMNRGEIEDHVQMVMERVWKNIDSFDPARAKFSTWVATITRNLIKDSWRQRERRPQPALRSTGPAGARGCGRPDGSAAPDPVELLIDLAAPQPAASPELALLLDQYLEGIRVPAEREVVTAVLCVGYRIADVKAMRPDLKSRVDRWIRKARTALANAIDAE